METEISVEKIEIGMELTSEVVNKFGKALLPAHTKFEEKHRILLKTWGIRQVKINVEQYFENEFVITEMQRESALELLKQRMNWEPRNDHEKDLLEIAIQRICLTS